MKRIVFLSALVGICILLFCLLSIGIAFVARSFNSASPTIFLPLVATSPAISTQLIQPNDFQYLGAFRLPNGSARPRTFEYGGNAMTFTPNGDPSGASDGFPGSLFVMGHERISHRRCRV